MLKSKHINEVQKNWLPFSENGKIYVVYRLSPFTILEVNEETGDTTENVVHVTKQWHFPHLRNSSGPIEWDNQYIMICHFIDNVNKYDYYNRFIILDKETKKPIKMSQTFRIENPGIEFISGMCTYKNYLYLTYGYKDCEAKQVRYTIPSVNRLTWYNLK
jgi:hypothetical protein